MRRSSGLRTPASTIVHSLPGPTRNRATSSSGFCVAERPMRCTSRPACSASRSSVTARCAPRLVCATAWISSTITHCVPVKSSPRLRGEHEVQRLGRGDEDVGRGAQHRRPFPLRRVAGAHRDAHVGADAAQRRLQVALDVVAQGLERRDVDEPERRAPAGRPAAARRRSGRAPTGRRRASCRTRWAPRRACARRRRWPARPAPARAWAPRTPARTTHGPAR